MNSHWHVTVTLLLITGITGCSRFRDLTRRDYALLRDPFVNRFSADQDVAETAAASADVTGRITIDDTSTAAADYGARGESRDENAPATPPTNGRLHELQVRSSNDDIASSSGPSLSDFIGHRPEPSKTTMPPMPESPVGGTNAADFGLFAEKRVAAAEETATAGAAGDDFSDWASQQHKKWNGKGPPTTDRDNAVAGRIRQVTQIVNTAADDDDLPTLPSPDLGGFGTDTATPLIRTTGQHVATGSRNAATNPPIGTGTPFAGAMSGNDVGMPPTSQSSIQPATTSRANIDAHAPLQPPAFDSSASESPTHSDPFAEFDESRRTATDPFAAATAKRKAEANGQMDSTFRFDTGWNPSNLVRP